MAEETRFKCSGDCLNCRVNPNERKTQWQYCAAQFTYNSMRMIESLHGEIKTMQGIAEELKAKIEAIQNCEATVFDPQSEDLSEIPINIENTTQEGDGAEIDAPKQLNK